MASHPTYVDHHAETDSGAFFKAAAVLLGIAVGILGFFALMMWSDAHNARDDANAAASAAQPAAQQHAGALPLNSFAGVVPPNAQALAEAHKAYDATLPPAPAGPVAKIHLTLKDMTVQIAPGVKYNTWSFSGHGAPGPDPARPPGPAGQDDADERWHDPALDRLPRRAHRAERRLPRRRSGQVLLVPVPGQRPGCLHVPLRHEAGADAHRERDVRRDRGQPDEAAPAGRQELRSRRQRVVHDDRRDQAAGVASTWPRRMRWSPTGRRSTATRTSTSRIR